MRLYTDAWGSHRPEMYAEAFHPLARISFTSADGSFHEDLIADDYDEWVDCDIHVSPRIISVMQAGDVTCVVLGFDADDDPAQS